MAHDSQPVPVTAAIGVLGWDHLDPVLLAALALEAPVLLLGEHGTAKTLLAERVAEALGSCFRHYNASILNYDDLVGIPLPTDDGTGLRFVGTNGSIWGAEFAFFDEINRCRPDLQNKMFPLVHERRVAGVDLPSLRHRWAAMNPPTGTESPASSFDYLGVEPLDPALADRFWFVVRAPSWSRLTREQRERLVSGTVIDTSTLDLARLVAAVGTRLAVVEATWGATVVDYVVNLVDLLRSAEIHLSPRRARMLAQAVTATVAAAEVLRHPVDVGMIAELVVMNGLPQWCNENPPAVAAVVAAHQQAWDMALNSSDTIRRQLLAVDDPVERLRLGLELDAPDDTLGTLVIGAVSAQETEAERIGLSFVLSQALGERPMTPAAWGAIGERAARMLRPASYSASLAPGRQMEAWRTASAQLAEIDRTDGDTEEYALITACGPELLAEVDLGRLLRRFTEWTQVFERAA
ncbi:MAG: hypothetical protein RI958_616 [Actinomycetota bacterium]